jgi:hypothetical protein
MQSYKLRTPGIAAQASALNHPSHRLTAVRQTANKSRCLQEQQLGSGSALGSAASVMACAVLVSQQMAPEPEPEPPRSDFVISIGTALVAQSHFFAASTSRACR